MDADGSGKLTKDELLTAFHVSQDFRNIMMLLDVQEGDLEAIFKLLDQDASGDLDYEEFCEELIQLETQDQRLTLALTRLTVVEIRQVQSVIDAKLGNVIETLGSHSTSLRRLDAKLDQMLATSGDVQVSETHVDSTSSVPGSKNFQELQSRAATSKSEAFNIGSDLLQIAHDIKRVSIVESEIVQRVQQQIAALRIHE